jgi:outer membrane receptor protein involved in Fe transport
MPVIQDRPFAYALGLEAGYRYSDYSTAGSVSNYKFGGDWAPVNGVRFRGIYQRATRAPNLYELYSPVVAGTGTLATDPCAGASVAADVAAICVAQGARASSIGSIAAPTAGQINIFTGGNPNLKAEKSDTFTVGVVVNPVTMRRLSFSLDYYNIKIANAIDTVPASVKVAQCYSSGNATSAACSGIVRNPNGLLSGNIQYGVPEVYGNLSKLSTSGLDMSTRYDGGDREGFFYSVAISGTYTFDYKKQTDPGEQAIQCAGRFGAACDLEPISKWKHVAELGLGWKQMQLLTRWRYLGAVHEDAGTDILVSRIPGISYFDLTFTATVKEGIAFRLGMQNVFDKQSPIIGDAVNQYVAGNTFPNTYDVMGRTFFAGFTAKL